MTDAVVGAILAGGASRRMGGTDKATMVLGDGRTMIATVAAALDAVCAEVVILGPPGVLPGRDVIADAVAEAGPLGGIAALLGSGRAERYLVCPCDVPRITPDLLRRLIDVEAPDGAIVAFRRPGRGGPDGLPAVIPASAAEIARRRAAGDDRSVRGLQAEVGVVEVTLTEAQTRELVNVNTPADAAGL